MNLHENPAVNSAGQIADHAMLKAAYDSRGSNTALAPLTATSTDAEHRAIHAALHAEHNTVGAAVALPTTLVGGQTGHLVHHAVLHKAYNARLASAIITTYRGVNLSGAEFADNAAHLPGIANTDYLYPKQADLIYVASRGHKMIRLPIRWERIQPTLLGPLNVAELSRLTAAIGQASAAGLRVLVDVHNYARFIKSAANGGATLVLGGGTLTNAHLVDLWTRLSTALRGTAGVLGYGLMNEPNSLPAGSAAFTSATTVWNFDGSAQPWSGEADAVAVRSTAPGSFHDGSGSLKVTRTLPAGGAQIVRVNDGASNTLVRAKGDTLAAWVLVPFGAPGTTWSAHLEMQNASYQWQPGRDSSLIPGRWAQLFYTPTDTTWLNHKGVAVQFTSHQTAGTPVTVYIDTIQQGAQAATRTQAQQWEQASQGCVDAIRTNNDTTPIFVPGYQFQGAQNWPTNHPRPWITDPAQNIVYEAHYYFDGNNSGTYTKTYSAENADAISRGYASLRSRATTELGRFLNWCSANSVTGFIGEIGWSNRADTTSWNAIGQALYDAMDAAKVGSSYWAAGEWYGTNYNLSIYTGTPLSRRASPAPTVEDHSTKPG